MAILKENWSTLTKPTSIVLKEGYNNLTKSVIVMEPFARGYGNTLGNSLRRVLLSSINGFAVTSVKIEGVMHEYATIDGIKEDVLDIIMNLKGLAITKDDPSPSILKFASMNSRSFASSGSCKSLTRVSGFTPVAARVACARVNPIPKMYVSAISTRFSRGRSTPTRRAICNS